MTSNINANNIDATYPVAGVDNDSQGFRTNFTNIKNNLAYAAAEISDLQSNAVLKSALTGTTLNNSMAGALLSGASIKDFREVVYTGLGTTSGTVTLNHANGPYQTVTTADSISLAFSNLPAAGYLGRIRLAVTVANTSHTLTLPASVTLGVEGIGGLNISTGIITFTETGTFVFEFTTADAGVNIHIQDLTRPRDYFHSNHLKLVSRQITNDVGATGDVAGQLVVDTTTPAIWLATANYDGTSHIWRKAELESINNEVFLASNSTTTSSSFSTITGMTFTADANVTYHFDVFLPFQHSAGATNTHSFSVNFTGGTCYALVQQQTSNTSAFTNATITTSDSTAGVATTGQANVTRIARMTGIFTNTADTTVSFRFATSGGTLTALAGGFARFNRK
jgi:hypothetical protein